ncbi:MAG: hypothetical protein JWN01_86 [Patescibacteria group bacterium]|nr:hypothetical protein [Patescibacteria group bacterium]
MVLRYLRLLQLLLASAALFAGGHALAFANTPSIDPAYNSNVIEDPVFLNKNTMSAQDIQNFLNAKVPVCDTGHQGGLAQYPPPYTCLKDYTDPTTGKKAAQLIYDEAQAVGLNPQVILVTLQKEQSLVTDTWPYPSQYRSAMGYGCPESQAVCDAQYYGFYNQIHLGARLLRAGAARNCGDNATLPGWSIDARWHIGNSPAVDGVATHLESCATGALYNYTPHRPDSAYTSRGGAYYYGNYNFINYFTSWFGPTRLALAKSADQPQIYLTLGTRKIVIPSIQMMAVWGFIGKNVSIVDQSYLDGLTSDGTLTTLAKKDNGSSTIYMIDGGRHFSVPSGQACTDWAFSCGDSNVVKNVSANVIESLSYAGDLPTMFSNDGVFKPEAGKKRPVFNQSALDVLGGWGHVQLMGSLNTSQPVGTVVMVNDTVVKFTPSQAIYLFDQDQLHAFNSPEMLGAWAAGGRAVGDAPDSFATGLTVGAPFAAIASDGGGGKWLVNQGGRYSLGGREGDWPVGSAVGFAQGALSRLPVRGLSPVLHSPSGAIFTATGGKRYGFPTFDDFFGLGNRLDMIGEVSAQTEALLTYGGAHLVGGRVYKVAGSDAIYVNNGAGSLQIATLGDLGAYRLPAERAITVDATTAARYPSAGALGPLFKSGDGTVYLATGSRNRLSAGTISAYGLSTGSLPTLIDLITNRIPQGRDLTQFIKGSSGAIYYVSGGQRHYVDTQAKLNSLGGGGNVMDVPDSLLNLVSIGSPA